MKAIDKDGLLLCDVQAKTFELSVDKTELGSAGFVRRFMNSRVAKWMDNGGILSSNMQPSDLLELVEEQYGPSEYGSKKYTHNEMFWIGYVYRYYSYTYEKTSASIYREIKPKELRDLYLPYHTLDPSQAIERILEAKGTKADSENDLMRQYEIYRKIRGSYGAQDSQVSLEIAESADSE
jgi:hypothetical protein